MADIKFTSNVNDILSALEKGKRNALTAIGATAETHTKENITADGLVDTGRLRNSISYAEYFYLLTKLKLCVIINTESNNLTAK